MYLFKLPAVRHGGYHLRQLLLLALQHTVNMLQGNLKDKQRRGAEKDKRMERDALFMVQAIQIERHGPVMFYSRDP